MEREINSTFYDKHFDVSLLVVETKIVCDGCFYNGVDFSSVCSDKRNIAGICGGRSDKRSVIFIKQT
jgi:hypothetical protein